MHEMYPAQANSPLTTLVQAIDAAQTTIEVVDGSVLPNAPNLAVIGAGENAETVLYEEKAGNVLSGVTRGFQGTARSWEAGIEIGRLYTAYDHDAMRENFIAHGADNTPHREAASMERSEQDSEGVFTVIEYKRADGTLFKKSELSGGTSPEYTTRTVDFYGTDGTSIIQTVVYTLSYDGDGNLTSEVIQP